MFVQTLVVVEALDAGAGFTVAGGVVFFGGGPPVGGFAPPTFILGKR